MEIRQNNYDYTPRMTGSVKLIFKDVNTGTEEVYHILNVVVQAGKVSIARRLGNAEAGYGKITYCATGTNVAAPAASDAQMGTELFRKAISVVTLNSNVVTFTTYFATSESNGTLKEVGLFGDDATSAAGSGTMYAHTAITRTKTSSDTLTIEWSVTVN
jgi:hypothetical protein